MTAYRIDPSLRKPPRPEDVKPKPARISRQKIKRMTSTAEYNALRDIYLEQNPECAICGRASNQLHHICRGVHRAGSLRNTDTVLAVCSIEHHDQLERMTVEQQIKLKQKMVRETIERLRR